MSQSLESISDFARRIKTKFPDYESVPDDELVSRVTAKHPEYKTRISGLDAAPNVAGSPSITPRNSLQQKVYQKADEIGVPRDFVSRLVGTESSWTHTTPSGRVLTSPKNARGLFQVVPDNGSQRTIGGKTYNVDNLDENIEAGLRYAKQGLDAAGGDPHLASLYYFGGPGAFQRAKRTGRIPNISDGGSTASQYVRNVGGSAPITAPLQRGTTSLNRLRAQNDAATAPIAREANRLALANAEGQPQEPLPPIQPQQNAPTIRPLTPHEEARTDEFAPAGQDIFTVQAQPSQIDVVGNEAVAVNQQRRVAQQAYERKMTAYRQARAEAVRQQQADANMRAGLVTAHQQPRGNVDLRAAVEGVAIPHRPLVRQPIQAASMQAASPRANKIAEMANELRDSSRLGRLVKSAMMEGASDVDYLGSGLFRMLNIGPDSTKSTALSKIEKFLRERGEDYDQAVEQGNLEQETHAPATATEKLARFVARLPVDVATTAIATELGGGPIGGFAGQAGLSAAGHGATPAEIAKETAKGALTGGIFRAAAPLSMGKRAATVATGTVGVEKLFGSDNQQAASSAAVNAIFSALGGRGGTGFRDLAGKYIRFNTPKGSGVGKVVYEEGGPKVLNASPAEFTRAPADSFVDFDYVNGEWVRRGANEQPPVLGRQIGDAGRTTAEKYGVAAPLNEQGQPIESTTALERRPPQDTWRVENRDGKWVAISPDNIRDAREYPGTRGGYGQAIERMRNLADAELKATRNLKPGRILPPPAIPERPVVPIGGTEPPQAPPMRGSQPPSVPLSPGTPAPEPPHHSNFQPRRVRGEKAGQFKRGAPVYPEVSAAAPPAERQPQPLQAQPQATQPVGVNGKERQMLSVTLDSGRAVKVYKNPTPADFAEMRARHDREYPDALAGEPSTRFTRDAEGNYYSWMSGDAIHNWVEPRLKSKYGVDTNQNMQPRSEPQVSGETPAIAPTVGLPKSNAESAAPADNVFAGNVEAEIARTKEPFKVDAHGQLVNYRTLLDIEGGRGAFAERSISDTRARDAGNLYDAIRKRDIATVKKIANKYERAALKGEGLTGGPRPFKPADAVQSTIGRLALNARFDLEAEAKLASISASVEQSKLPSRTALTPQASTPPQILTSKGKESIDVSKAQGEVEPRGRGAQAPLPEPKADVGPYGKLSSLLRLPATHTETGAELIPFAAHPAVRQVLGLGEMPSYSTKGEEGKLYHAAAQETLDALAANMNVARSSYLGTQGVEAFIRKHRDKLPDDVVESYVATAARHGQHVEKQRRFLLDTNVNSLLKQIEGGNETRGTVTQIKQAARHYGLSPAHADAAIKTARAIRNESTSPEVSGLVRTGGSQPDTPATTAPAQAAQTEALSGLTVSASRLGSSSGLEVGPHYTPTTPSIKEAELRSLLRNRIIDRAEFDKRMAGLRKGEAGFINVSEIASAIQRNAIDALNAPRAFMSSFDLSAPLRQGAILTLTEPKATIAAMRGMFGALVSTGKYNRIGSAIATDPDFSLAQDSGLYLSMIEQAKARAAQAAYQAKVTAAKAAGTPLPKRPLSVREESFMSELAEKIPHVKYSEQAYIAYLDLMRFQSFKKYARALRAAGLNPTTNPNEFKGIASFINNATGRGDLGQTLNNAAPALNAIFFSPRYLASRLNLLNPITYAKLPPEARKIAMKKMLEFAGLVGLGLLLATLAGASVEWDDPESPDWLKAKVGNTRYDFLAGFQQPMRFVYRMAKAMKRNAVGEKNERGRNATDIGMNFTRSKLSPVASYVYDWMSGTTFSGEKFQPAQGVTDRVIPMVGRDFYEAYKDAGGLGLIKTTPSIFGVGVQTYNPRGKSANAPSSFTRTSGRGGLRPLTRGSSRNTSRSGTR